MYSTSGEKKKRGCGAEAKGTVLSPALEEPGCTSQDWKGKNQGDDLPSSVPSALADSCLPPVSSFSLNTQ